MSKTPLLIALACLVLLGIAALVVLPRAPDAPGSPGVPPIQLDPARVVELRLDRPDGRTERILRAEGHDGGWTVILPSPAGAKSSWPAAPGHVRGALRFLFLLDGSPAPDSTIPPGGPTLTITDDEGRATSLRFAPRPLAGHVLAAITRAGATHNIRIPAPEADALTGGGPAAWRDPAAIPGIGPDISRIRIASPAAVIALARIQGHWSLTEPFAEPASRDAVGALASRLASIRIVDFLDGAAPADEITGLASPVLTITTQADDRARTSRRVLSIGGAADMSGARLYAGADGRPVVIDAEPLASLSSDPVSYISRTALRTTAADIGRLVVAPADAPARSYGRSIGRWYRDGAGDAPVAPNDAAALDALAMLIAQQPADAVLLSPPEGAAPLARLEVQTLGAATIGTVDLATVSPDPASPPVLIVGDARVWRAYSGDAPARILAWLAGPL